MLPSNFLFIDSLPTHSFRILTCMDTFHIIAVFKYSVTTIISLIGHLSILWLSRRLCHSCRFSIRGIVVMGNTRLHIISSAQLSIIQWSHIRYYLSGPYHLILVLSHIHNIELLLQVWSKVVDSHASFS